MLPLCERSLVPILEHSAYGVASATRWDAGTSSPGVPSMPASKSLQNPGLLRSRQVWPTGRSRAFSGPTSRPGRDRIRTHAPRRVGRVWSPHVSCHVFDRHMASELCLIYVPSWSAYILIVPAVRRLDRSAVRRAGKITILYSEIPSRTWFQRCSGTAAFRSSAGAAGVWDICGRLGNGNLPVDVTQSAAHQDASDEAIWSPSRSARAGIGSGPIGRAGSPSSSPSAPRS